MGGPGGEEHSGQREQHGQRPWGRTVPGVFKEQQRGRCGMSRVSEGAGGSEGREVAGTRPKRCYCTSPSKH